MSRPLCFLLCASAAAFIFGSEPSAFLAAQAQVADVAAPLPKFRGTHRVRAFHRAPIGAPYNGGIGAASRVGGKARNGGVDATSAIGGIGGASDVGGPALTQWRLAARSAACLTSEARRSTEVLRGSAAARTSEARRSTGGLSADQLASEARRSAGPSSAERLPWASPIEQRLCEQDGGSLPAG